MGAPEDERLRHAVEDNYDGLYRYLRRLGVSVDDVEDAVQEVAARMAPRLAQIEAGREKAFAYGTAFRVACEWRRVSRREVKGDDVEEAPSLDPSPEATSDDRRARALLDRIIGEMPISLRAVFVLFEIEEHTMAEIAVQLGIPPGTVASRLRRARADFEAAVERFERAPVAAPKSAGLTGMRGA